MAGTGTKGTATKPYRSPERTPLQRYTHHTIEQGDREEAENVFRETAEVARDEVIVLDGYDN